MARARTTARHTFGAFGAARRRVRGALTLILIVTAGALPTAVRAEPVAPAPTRPDEVRAGAMLFATETEGSYLPAPLLATDVEIDIAGPVAEVHVRQSFVNPTDSWLEGVYAFPLPENAAVSRMRLVVGDRAIDAEIRERGEARRVYDRARRDGRRGALIEQERPNIFTNSVANIGPKETITVELTYHQTLRYDQGEFRLRFPMVVAPRYIPGPMTVVRADDGATGWATAPSASAVPDAEAISPPVLHPAEGRINPVTLAIRLDAGFPISALASPFHPIVSDDWHDGTAEIELAEGPVPADRDFELVWSPQRGAAPVAGVFREDIGADRYLLVMILPPHEDRGVDLVPPREAIFVVDHSGSMAGASMPQAREALILALDRLRPSDRFNVVAFNNSADALFPAPRQASSSNVQIAKSYVRSLAAEGGTEMLSALRLALPSRGHDGFVRQIVFLTDGAVGNEVQLFREISQGLGDSRLFTVGIGSAPNSFFMRKAAESGRGSFTHIGDLSQVAGRMSGLFRKLEQPVLTDLLTQWSVPGATVDAYPRLTPDLYHGEPLALAVRLEGGAGNAEKAALRIAGKFRQRGWHTELDLSAARDARGISTLWGRARIGDLIDSLRQGANADTVRQAVIETALAHRLVSKYTSLVAVEEAVARPNDTPLATRRLPVNLPQGWDYEKVFGETLKRSAPPAPIETLKRNAGADRAEAATRFAKAAPAAGGRLQALAIQSPKAVTLPQGATWGPFYFIGGGTLLLVAFMLAAWLSIRREETATASARR